MIQYNTILKLIADIDKTQKSILNMEKPDFSHYEVQISQISEEIQALNNTDSLRRLESEIKTLEGQIEHEDISLELLKESNLETQEKIKNIGKDIADYEYRLRECKKNYENESKKIDTLLHEQLLQNIERRNNLQRLQLQCIDNKRNSRSSVIPPSLIK
ncbi:unnamed protein product [Blepharisma stoltei]|uniref:Uncharacterized protein n=1 Tax=Blepharisma stoltei TaxID=1481888 RepID=A0AAU9IUW1_9CILI|nr:unnamed protein product [Blepharisma stoltei]